MQTTLSIIKPDGVQKKLIGEVIATFEKKGFKRLPNEEKKVLWIECAQCDKYDICRQILMRLVF